MAEILADGLFFRHIRRPTGDERAECSIKLLLLSSLHLKCLPRIFFPEFCPSKLLTPLFFSPQHPAHSAGPAQNESLPRPFGVFFSNFCFQNTFQNLTFKQHRKKLENKGFWPPKTVPKPFKNPSQIDVPEQA